jgi:ABC-type protease/lipase transport system fused ATPase/permease subunit
MTTGLLCMALSAYLVITGQLSGGALVATMMIVWRLTGPMQNLFLAANALVRTRANIRQIENLMRLPIERESGIKPAVRPQLGGELGFARVSFRYANDADPALLGLNFTVAPGAMVPASRPCSNCWCAFMRRRRAPSVSTRWTCASWPRLSCAAISAICRSNAKSSTAPCART